MDVEHVLELDEKIDVEHHVVEAGANCSLDRVLDRDEGGVDLLLVGGVEGVRDRGHRDRFGTGQRGNRQECLLAEGALGPQEGDRAPTLHSCSHEGRIVTPMDELEIRQLIDDLRSGACSPDDAVMILRRLPFAELGFAKVDHHRTLRQGLPEAVYGPGKTPSQSAAIVDEMLAGGGRGPVLLTRADQAQVAASMAACPGGERTPLEPEVGRLSTVVWRTRKRSGPDACSCARPGRATCRWPRSARQCFAPSGFDRPSSPTAG